MLKSMTKRIRDLYNKYPTLVTFLLYVIVAMLAWWQISFLAYSVKWDMLDCFLPWRYFVGECWQNGIVPFWNPYQHFGYPIHADMRSAWYPEMFIIGLAGGYTNITLHFLSIFYLALAGLGMSKLTGFILKSDGIPIIAGMAYLLSGFFIGHGQDIGYIIGGAFTPWVIHYYLRLIDELKLINTFKTALFFLLMILGAYPAFTIFICYILAVFFIYHFFDLVKRNQPGRIWQFLAHHLLLLILLSAGSLVLILTYPQVAPFSERFVGMVYEDFITNPFSPQSLISWVTPFVIANNEQLFNSDISMINAYWGLLMMLFFFFAFKRSNYLLHIFLLIAFVSLFLSFGPYTFVHRLFYDYAPGIKLFRMPGIFILFTILGLLVASGFGLKNIFDNYSIQHGKIKRAVLYGAGFMLVIVVVGLIKFPIHDSVFIDWPGSYPEFLSGIAFFEQLTLHGLIQVILLLSFYFLIRIGRKELFLFKVGILVFLEMAIAVQLNINHTGINRHNPTEVKEKLCEMPLFYPTPDNRQIREHNEKASKMMPLWHNVSIFTKRPAFDGFNSFVLNQYNDLFDNYPALANAVMNNPLVFLSSEFLPISQYIKMNPEELSGRELFINDSLLNDLDLPEMNRNKGDTVRIVKFTPNEIRLECTSKESQLLCLMQSNYFGWKAFVDDIPVKHFTSNILFRTLLVPAGSHRVTFKYENKTLIISFYISYSIILILLAVIIILHYRQLRRNNRTSAILFVAFVKVVLGVFVILVIKTQMDIVSFKNFESGLKDDIEDIVREETHLSCAINVSNPERWTGISIPCEVMHLLDRKDLSGFYKRLGNNNHEKFLYVWYNRIQLPEIMEIIKLKYPKVISSKIKERGGYILFGKSGDEPEKPIYYQVLDFESAKKELFVDSLSHETGLSSPVGYVYRVDAKTEWGPGIRQEIAENHIHKLRIIASCDILLPDTCNIIFAVKIVRDGKQLKWDRINLCENLKGSPRWEKVILGFEPGIQLQKGDEVKAFIWNRGRSDFAIDNYELKLIIKDY